jgi:dTDP-4-amino-4,6-dideoxygalactose transaminase
LPAREEKNTGARRLLESNREEWTFFRSGAKRIDSSMNSGVQFICAKTPAPRWRDLFAISKGLPAPLDRGWVWLSMNGRNAIYHALRQLGIEPGREVLVPAFHCTALVEPLLAYGVRVRFYPVHRDFTIDLDDIEHGLREGARALLLIHFLGFPAPVEEARRLCHAHKAALIEDCTHALYGRLGAKHLGTFGDAAVFSFRKTISVQDGGALMLSGSSRRQPSPQCKTPWLFQAKMAKWTLERLLGRNMDLNANSPAQTDARPAVQEQLSANTRTGPLTLEDPSFVMDWVNWPISWVSFRLLRSTRADTVCARRARNYRRLHQRLSKLPGLHPCFPELPAEVCPLGYPFVAESEQRLDYQLRGRGVPAFSFGEILHAAMPAAEFPEAVYLSKHLTLLPVHQGLSGAEVDRMADIVERLWVEKPQAIDTGHEGISVAEMRTPGHSNLELEPKGGYELRR